MAVVDDIKVGRERTLSWAAEHRIDLGNDRRMRWAEVRIALPRTTFEWSESSLHQLERIRPFIILQVYSKDECARFLSTTLANICTLALNVDKICSRVRQLFIVISIEILLRSLHLSYVTVQIAQWPCPNGKELLCWRVRSSVSIHAVSTRRSAVNMRITKTPTSIRLFRSTRDWDPWMLLIRLKVISRWPKRWIGVEVGKIEMRLPLFRSYRREEWGHSFRYLSASLNHNSSA